MTDAPSPRPGGAMVEFDGVGLRYGPDAEVLCDISFNLQPGSFYFLTGASGAGKTSLLKMLYLAQRPSRGIVRLFGEGNGGGQLQFATATEDRNALWKARHQALWAAKNMVPGAVAWITDVCVPISQLSDAIIRAKTAIEASGLFAPILGHVGDGNFHIFFILRTDDTASWDKARIINEAVIDQALSVGGTCTGEHGIGLGKRLAMQREHGADSVATMRRIKDALDPTGLFNPGKIFLDRL